MRTTIEMKPEHRARVLELAASRGEKGFSTVLLKRWNSIWTFRVAGRTRSETRSR